MGLSLPPELTEIAHLTGVSWPEADEDALRARARVWRRAAEDLRSLAREADACAVTALDALAGPVADAAARRWAGLGDPDTGAVAGAVRGAARAAEQLDHAAEQVARAKTEIVRQLVEAAKTRDGALVAADGGHPSAMLGLDAVLRATATNLEAVTGELAGAVGSGDAERVVSGGDVVPVQPGTREGVTLFDLVPDLPVVDPAAPSRDVVEAESDGVLHTVLEGGSSGTGLVADVMEPAVGDGAAGVRDGHEGAPNRGGVLGDPVGAVTEAGVAEWVGTGVDAVATQDTGPIPIAQLPTPPTGLNPGAGVFAELPTPPSGTAVPGGGPPSGHTHLAGFAPGAASAPPVPGGYPVAPGHPQAPQWSGHGGQQFGPPGVPGGAGAPVYGGTSGGPIQPSAFGGPSGWGRGVPAAGQPGRFSPLPPGQPGTGRWAGPPVPSVASPWAPGGTHRSAPAPNVPHQPPIYAPQQTHGPHGAPPQPPGRPGYQGHPGQPGYPGQPGERQGPPQPASPVSHQAPRHPSQSVPPGHRPPTPSPHPGASAVAVGAPRQERESVVALFVVHMFPIGHLPVASDTPARQLPVHRNADEAERRGFPPHDHPESARIDGESVWAALAGGSRHPAPPPAEVLPCPPEIVRHDYDPLGELSETEWDQRFRPADTTDAGTTREAEDGDANGGVGSAVPTTGSASGHRVGYVWPSSTRWPEGCHEPGEAVLLPVGVVLDRFGTAHGRIFADDGTPFAQRSSPPSYLDAGYRRYRVARDLPVWKAVCAPWFGQPGGGVRYRALYSAAELVVLGYLVDITFEERI